MLPLEATGLASTLPALLLPCLSQQPVAPRGLAWVLLMIASQGHLVELECLRVRAKVLGADVSAPAWPDLQICVMA